MYCIHKQVSNTFQKHTLPEDYSDPGRPISAERKASIIIKNIMDFIRRSVFAVLIDNTIFKAEF